MNEDQVNFGSGVKAWLIICIVFSVPALFINLTTGYYLLAIGGAGAIGGFIWLLTKKVRMAYYLILASTILIAVVNIVVYGLNPILSLVGLINPSLTYLLISKHWGQMK